MHTKENGGGMYTYMIRDVYSDGSVKETDCLSMDEAASLIQCAQRYIDSGLLRECIMMDREGKEIVRIS